MKKRFFNLKARFDGNVFSRAEYDDPEFLHLMDMMDQLLQRHEVLMKTARVLNCTMIAHVHSHFVCFVMSWHI